MADTNGDAEKIQTVPTVPDTEELSVFRYRWKEELGLAAPSDNLQEHDHPQDHPQDPSSEPCPEPHPEPRPEPHPTSPERAVMPTKADQSPPEQVMSQPLDPKNDAARLYWMGVAAEQSGDMNGAIMYYRRAIQLDPNVDIKESQNPGPTLSEEEDEEDDDVLMDMLMGSDGEGVVLRELTEEFQRLSIGVFCHPRKPTKDTHISVLPVEVLRYILRWVASTQCDMRAVEQVSMVCKGFYLLAREPQLWRSACKKLWGDCSHPGTFGSWRRMFVLKPHLHFNGVYISKTSYVREGEHSVDGFYKPYHTVTYFRYLRFFSDGCVMYQTTPEEPGQVVGKLRHKHSSEAVLLGEYQVQDRNILIDLVASPPESQLQVHLRGGRGKHRHQHRREVVQERRFHLELLLNKRKTKQLTWLKHYCSTIHIPTGQEQVSQFSINYMYTPFHFSRVKSFTSSSTGVLQ